VESPLAKLRQGQEEENKAILRHFVHCVEFFANEGLPFRGHQGEDKVNFLYEKMNRGNFIATLQLLAKGSGTLDKHLKYASRNAKYTNKII